MNIEKNKNKTILSNYMEDDYLKLLSTTKKSIDDDDFKEEKDFTSAYDYIDEMSDTKKMLDIIIVNRCKVANSQKYLDLLNKNTQKAREFYNDLLSELYIFMLENNIQKGVLEMYTLDDFKRCAKLIDSIVYKDAKTEYKDFYIDALQDDDDNDYIHFKSFKKYLSYEIDATEEKDVYYSNILSFDDLKQEELQLLQMKYLENMTSKEIANELHITPTNVTTKISRLKAKIQKEEAFLDYLNTKENKEKERKAREFYNYPHYTKIMDVKDLSTLDIARLLKDYKGIDLSKTYQVENILKLSYK